MVGDRGVGRTRGIKWELKLLKSSKYADVDFVLWGCRGSLSLEGSGRGGG